MQLRKILFCTDSSEHSGRALTYAFSLAMEYNAELKLMHVLDDGQLTPPQWGKGPAPAA